MFAVLQLSRGTGTDPEEGQADPGVEVFHALERSGVLHVYAETTEANRSTKRPGERDKRGSCTAGGGGRRGINYRRRSGSADLLTVAPFRDSWPTAPKIRRRQPRSLGNTSEDNK